MLDEDVTVVVPNPVPSHTWTGLGLAETLPVGAVQEKLTEVAVAPPGVTEMLVGAFTQPEGMVSDSVPVTVVAPVALTLLVVW